MGEGKLSHPLGHKWVRSRLMGTGLEAIVLHGNKSVPKGLILQDPTCRTESPRLLEVKGTGGFRGQGMDWVVSVSWEEVQF